MDEGTDVASDCYEWRGIPFAAWLLRIARNEVARQQRRPASEPLLNDPSTEENEIEDAERRAMVFRLLRALPVDQRCVLTLRFGHDQSVRQVATALGKTEGAVKQLQHRGLETLRRLEGAV